MSWICVKRLNDGYRLIKTSWFSRRRLWDDFSSGNYCDGIVCCFLISCLYIEMERSRFFSNWATRGPRVTTAMFVTVSTLVSRRCFRQFAAVWRNALMQELHEAVFVELRPCSSGVRHRTTCPLAFGLYLPLVRWALYSIKRDLTIFWLSIRTVWGGPTEVCQWRNLGDTEEFCQGMFDCIEHCRFKSLTRVRIAGLDCVLNLFATVLTTSASISPCLSAIWDPTIWFALGYHHDTEIGQSSVYLAPGVLWQFSYDGVELLRPLRVFQDFCARGSPSLSLLDGSCC